LLSEIQRHVKITQTNHTSQSKNGGNEIMRVCQSVILRVSRIIRKSWTKLYEIFHGTGNQLHFWCDLDTGISHRCPLDKCTGAETNQTICEKFFFIVT